MCSFKCLQAEYIRQQQLFLQQQQQAQQEEWMRQQQLIQLQQQQQQQQQSLFAAQSLQTQPTGFGCAFSDHGGDPRLIPFYLTAGPTTHLPPPHLLRRHSLLPSPNLHPST